MATNAQSPWLTRREGRFKLAEGGVSVDTMRRLEGEGQLRVMRLRGRVYYHRADIERILRGEERIWCTPEARNYQRRLRERMQRRLEEETG